jgi:7-cyano-7-deazaguanine synthase
MKELEKELLEGVEDKSCIILLSGGIDSATLLFILKQFNFEIHSLSFNYYRRNQKEIEASRYLSRLANVKSHIEVDLQFLKELSDLNDSFSRKILNGFNLPSFYIPARNGIFFYISVYFAESLGVSRIFTGHTKEDTLRLPDVNDAFINSINSSIKKGTIVGKIKGLKVVLPFKKFSKIDLLKYIIQYNVPLEYTWSCHSTSEKPCNECIGCKERKKILESIEFLRKK